jgi:uncharacterized membrane protein
MSPALTPAVIGGAAGVALAFAGLAFGFWGFLLVLILGAIGAVMGAAATGTLDLRAAVDAARGGRRAG